MDEKRIRTTIVLYPWIRKALKQLAANTGQQMSDFINEVLSERLAELGYVKPQNYRDLAHLVKSNRDWLLGQTHLKAEELQQIVDGNPVDHITRLRLALALEMSEDEITDLNSKQKNYQHNGEKEKCQK